MIITRLVLTNWRNFKTADIRLRDRTYVLGPNASGKSNLLDVFRFLRDISKAEGGGLQAAVRKRGGMAKLRCLHSRNKPNDIRIEVEISDSADAVEPVWRYVLAFNADTKAGKRPVVTNEAVFHKDEGILFRPDMPEFKDPFLLTQTALESVHQNRDFREVAELFAEVNYLHLVPQLLKFADEIGGNRLEGDPFGQGFLERVAATPETTRKRRLERIQKALAAAVPQFEEIRFAKDEVTGRPHLEMRYAHHRPKAGWQREDQFSDGTLRLLALLWALIDGHGLLLLEEPELSLHSAIVEQIPLLLEKARNGSKERRQIIISSHSDALLSNPGIDGRGVVVLEPQQEGTTARPLNEEERAALADGFTVAETVLPRTRPKTAEQLVLL